MTIAGWIIFALIGGTVALCGLLIFYVVDSTAIKSICLFVTTALIVGLLAGMMWYYNNTASGKRAMVDQKSDLANGMNRTITVYTADGKIIAQYTGRIDIEGNDGGYVLFDFDGKRYTYYNCFVESIANTE